MRAVVARRFRNYGAVRTDPGPRRTPGCRAAPEDSRDLALGHALLDLRGVGARDRALLPARRRTGTAPTPLLELDDETVGRGELRRTDEPPEEA
jgi:hypothetical protein